MAMHVPDWVRRGALRLVAIVGLLIAAELITTVLLVVLFRTRWRPGLDAVRRFNKQVGNPVASRVSGTRLTLVHHTGRTSGRDYVTPVWGERSGGWFFIQLPYGTDVDWCRNILAAGGCVLECGGVRYDARFPMIVGADEALPLLTPSLRRMHRITGVGWYLRLDVRDAVNAVQGTG